jgi:hypothetical protein
MTMVMNKTAGRLAAWLLAVLCCAGVTPAWAQNRFVTVDYMKVAPGQDDAYLQLEQKLWKPIHEARVKAGDAVGWYMYQVLSPSGSEAHHNYVTVAVYNSFEAMESPFPAALFAKVHPGLNMADFGKKTLGARDLVRSETWQSLARMPETPLAKPAPFMSVEYMRVPAGGGAAYTEVEQMWKKVHDLRIKDGTLASWSLLSRVLPAGSDYPYNYVTANGYARFKDLNGFDLEGLFKKAGLGMSLNEFGDRTQKARDLVRGEVWVLVDYVQASGQ